MGETAQEKGHSHVPECYVIPTRQRPSLNPQTAEIINHGIDQTVLVGAPSSALGFFGLPAKEKVKFISNDVNRPVRYGTSLKDGADKIQFWRVFLKHYAHPLEDFVKSWPQNPPYYRHIYDCIILNFVFYHIIIS
ncbi:Flavanone 3-dioxygenase 3 [Camellia lanceoleosa]|uniref:Flavanone 3-dioxygenase 3 n=1 Tax=Camellia lanceoleosa TaxID=1840588 RepID=A0ACC0H3T5_9ERIC|nr:Flavanone 3-dioxygenase 3 [Camellia lanceoleosa]